jgi:chromosome segregation ATPase
MELDRAKANKTIEHLQPKLEKTEEMYSREKARLGRVFEVAEELDEALQTATTEMSARDDWYVQHMQLFENLNQAIQTRYEMIDSAVQAMAEFRQKQDTFKERMDEALDAVKDKINSPFSVKWALITAFPPITTLSPIVTDPQSLILGEFIWAPFPILAPDNL